MEEQHLAHQNKNINKNKQYSKKAFLLYLHFLKSNKNSLVKKSLIKIGKLLCAMKHVFLFTPWCMESNSY